MKSTISTIVKYCQKMYNCNKCVSQLCFFFAVVHFVSQLCHFFRSCANFLYDSYVQFRSCAIFFAVVHFVSQLCNFFAVVLINRIVLTNPNIRF